MVSPGPASVGWTRRAHITAQALLVLLALAGPISAAPANDATIDAAIRSILEGDEDTTRTALATLRGIADRAAVAPLIQLLFWTDEPAPILEVLTAITGAAPGDTFFDWMVWQQDHPEITPYAGYEAVITELFLGLDINFARFLRPDIPRDIRFEEIVWGGVKVNAIPPLDNPTMIAAAEAAYLNPDDRVFGVELNGDARAYPLRIMNWHEMANDVVGGIPVSLAYCTLCGAGVLFDGRVEGAPTAVTFATSGLLYRSNKLMYDRISESLWNQFTGRPVLGQLVGTGVQLKPLPLVIETWATWRARHPTTRVLSLDTGFTRDYGPGVAYRDYFASPDLAFPTALRNRSLAPKDLVFGVRVPGGVKAWPMARFAGGAVINDQVGLLDVVLIGDAATGTVRAYEADGRRFTAEGDGLRAADGLWTIAEDGLHGPGGRMLARLAGNVAYWFAWNGYFGEILAP